MQISIKTIRDLEVIEKELNNISAGVFLFFTRNEFEQFASSFVYHDKNIYLFVNDSDVLKNIIFETKARFIAIKESSVDKKHEEKSGNIYSLISISVNGILKEVDEKKIKNTIKQSFIQKYSGKLIESGTKSKSFKKLVFIDSEELIATEETGV
jgi:hypothetical protein